MTSLTTKQNLTALTFYLTVRYGVHLGGTTSPIKSGVSRSSDIVYILHRCSGAVIHQNFVAVRGAATYVIRHLLLQFLFLDQISSSDPSFDIICNCEAHTCDETNSFPPLLFPPFVWVTNFFLSSEMMTELCLTTVIRDARCGEFCQNVQLFPLGFSTKYLSNISFQSLTTFTQQLQSLAVSLKRR